MSAAGLSLTMAMMRDVEFARIDVERAIDTLLLAHDSAPLIAAMLKQAAVFSHQTGMPWEHFESLALATLQGMRPPGEKS